MATKNIAVTPDLGKRIDALRSKETKQRTAAEYDTYLLETGVGRREALLTHAPPTGGKGKKAAKPAKAEKKVSKAVVKKAGGKTEAAKPAKAAAKPAKAEKAAAKPAKAEAKAGKGEKKKEKKVLRNEAGEAELDFSA
jgi:hypothetical protein